MAITFPNSPSSGDTHTTSNGLQYTYDGEKWTTIGTNSAGTWTRSGTTVSLTTAGDDLNVDSGTLFVDASTNNVGVGTTSPGTKLDILGGSDASVILTVNGADSSSEYLGLGINAGAAVITAGGNGSTSNALVFKTAPSGTETERMRINSAGEVLIGTTSADSGTQLTVCATGTSKFAKLDLWGTNSNGDNSCRSRILSRQGSGLTDSVLTFSTRSSGSLDERMRIDSSGRVGIGTASPGRTLDVAGSIRSGGSTNPFLALNDNTTEAYFEIASSVTRVSSGTSQPLAFRIGSSEKARIDSSGRLLVGTSTGRNVGANSQGSFQLEQSASAVSASIVNNVNSATGAIISLAKTRGSSPGSAIVVQNNDQLGELRFAGGDGTSVEINAARIGCFVDGTPGANDMPGRLVFSTTADGASSPTERMRIDSSGNVGIGTTSPQAITGYTVLTLNNSSQGGAIEFKNNNTSYGRLLQGSSAVILETKQNIPLVFGTGTSSTERMRIDTSGRLGIGVTTMAGGSSSVTILRNSALRWADSNGTQRADIYGDSSSNLVFRNGTGSTERMRIDSSGNVLVGKAAASDSSGTGVQLLTGGGASVDIVTNAASNISVNHIYNINATRNGYRYYVSIDGGIRNFSGSNVNLSDEREKKNIVDMNSTWSELKQWTLRQFHFNSQDDSEDKCYGVVAQQIETVSPQVLSTFETNPTTTRKGVKEQKMMWMAIKALQEAQARIETLETEVAALKAG